MRGFTTQIKIPFDTAVAKVTEALSRAGGGTAIRTMLAVGLAATLSGCPMVGMMGVMHGGVLKHGSSGSGDGGKDNRAPRSEPQDCAGGDAGCDRSANQPEPAHGNAQR